MSKLLLLSDAQKATLDSWTSFTETALLQVLSSITPGTYNLYRISDVVSGTVIAAKTMAAFKAVGTYANGSSGSANVNWPTHVANDVGLLIEVFRADATPGALSAGWTQLCDVYTSSTAKRRMRISWKRAASGAETAATLTASAGGRTAVIVTFSGCLTSGTPCELLGSSNNIVSATAITIPSGAGPTQDKSLIVPIFATNQAAGGASLLSGGFVNADLTSLTSRSEYASPGQANGIYVGTGGRSVLGAMSDTTATITTACNCVAASIAFYPA